jgi:hypothetical protein
MPILHTFGWRKAREIDLNTDKFIYAFNRKLGLKSGMLRADK